MTKPVRNPVIVYFLIIFHATIVSNFQDNLTKCPACEKIGKSSNLRFFNINHDECVLLCSNKSCSYPFGYEDLQYSPIIADSNSTQQVGEFDIEFDLSLFENFEIKSNDHSSEVSTICRSLDQDNLNPNLCSHQQSPDPLNCNDASSIAKCADEELSNICNFNVNIENDNLEKLESDVIEDICLSVQSENSVSLPKPVIRDVQSASNDERKNVSSNKIRGSRFPKFTLDDCDLNSENDNDPSRDDQSNIHINSSSSSLDTNPIGNSSSDSFLNDMIDKICSKPDNINSQIISDSFIQNVIGN